MRKSYDTLSEVVRKVLGHDPLCGDYFLFVNRRRDRAKVLTFDGSGMCIYQKRMEKGRFASPWARAIEDATMTITMSELSLFLEGSQFVFIGQLSPRKVAPSTVVKRSLSV